MKKLFLVPILALLLITSCEKEKEATTATIQTTQAEDRSPNKVIICHLDEDGEYHTIQVNVNAVPAHLAHGDYLGPCCTGNICFDAEDIITDAPMGYYDSQENDCYGFFNCSAEGAVAIFTDEYSLFAGTCYGGYQHSILFITPDVTCEAFVGQNMTEEEYQCALRLMRDAIAANPNPVNICPQFKGSPNNEMVRKDALLNKMKQMLEKQVNH